MKALNYSNILTSITSKTKTHQSTITIIQQKSTPDLESRKSSIVSTQN
jgi:hypothetical protein